MAKFIAALGVTFCLTVPAAALQPLHEDQRVIDGFYALGLADIIRKQCDSISPRYLRAYNHLKTLERYARDMGYSDADIDALVDDDTHKDVLRARINRDLATRGASPESPEGYCAVGRDEIAKGSEAGKLLRNR